MVVAMVFVAQLSSSVVRAQQPILDVYKSATCGCCNKWVDHLRAHGFLVRATNREDLAGLKAAHHVPRHLQSCHLALVNGYAVEGHVPAADVQQLLRERPDIAGLAVQGMPIGSPGMEMPGHAAQPFDVIAFNKNGQTRVFARHGR